MYASGVKILKDTPTTINNYSRSRVALFPPFYFVSRKNARTALKQRVVRQLTELAGMLPMHIYRYFLKTQSRRPCTTRRGSLRVGKTTEERRLRMRVKVTRTFLGGALPLRPSQGDCHSPCPPSIAVARIGP